MLASLSEWALLVIAMASGSAGLSSPEAAQVLRQLLTDLKKEQLPVFDTFGGARPRKKRRGCARYPSRHRRLDL